MTVNFSVLSWLFGSGVLISFGKIVVNKLKANDKKTEAVCCGVQALLRDRLYQMYDHYHEKGYAPIYAKENFTNMYKQYHNLGLNGVMTEHYKKFMALPDKPKGGNIDDKSN